MKTLSNLQTNVAFNCNLSHDKCSKQKDTPLWPCYILVTFFSLHYHFQLKVAKFSRLFHAKLK